MQHTFGELVSKIHLEGNPFSGFPAVQWPINHWGGWGSHHHWMVDLVAELKPKTIIEVGSFLGGSALRMGGEIKRLELGSSIVCVDTWLAEEVLWNPSNNVRDKLGIKFGTPTFYYTFLSNVIDRGLQDVIVPLRMPSLPAARHLTNLSISASLIYIDGSHIEGDVIRDLRAYWKLVDEGGVMFVDDYREGMFEGVINDVNLFSKEIGIKFERDDDKALFRKTAPPSPKVLPKKK